MVSKAITVLNEWKLAHQVLVYVECSGGSPSQMEWQSPNSGSLKCNTDAALFQDFNSTGIGLCIRDHIGGFILGKTKYRFSPLLRVHEGEAYALLQAILWVQDLMLQHVVFETNSKLVAD